MNMLPVYGFLNLKETFYGATLQNVILIKILQIVLGYSTWRSIYYVYVRFIFLFMVL